MAARDAGQLVSMVCDSAAHGSTDIECGWQGSISEFITRRSIASSPSHYLLVKLLHDSCDDVATRSEGWLCGRTCRSF